MRKLIALLLLCLMSDHTLVFAADRPINPPAALPLRQGGLAPTDGILMAAAVREAVRLARLERTAQAAPAAGSGSGGHPVLIGAVVGAGVGAVVGATSTCSVPEAEARALGFEHGACGSRAGWALLGAGVGAGVGALIGLVFRH